jgi:hypothetical protein
MVFMTLSGFGDVGSPLITLSVFDPELVTSTRWFLASSTA